MKINASGEVLSEKVYGDPSGNAHWHGHRIIQLTDGNYLIVGERRTDESFNNLTGLAIKIDGTGNQIWQQYYPDVFALFDVLEDNGEFLLLGWYDDVGASNSGALLRADASGMKQWVKLFQVSNQTWPKRLFPAPGGDVLIAGRANVIGAGFGGIFVRRINADGEPIWTRTRNTDFIEREPREAFWVWSWELLSW